MEGRGHIPWEGSIRAAKGPWRLNVGERQRGDPQGSWVGGQMVVPLRKEAAAAWKRHWVCCKSLWGGNGHLPLCLQHLKDTLLHIYFKSAFCSDLPRAPSVLVTGLRTELRCPDSEQRCFTVIVPGSGFPGSSSRPATPRSTPGLADPCSPWDQNALTLQLHQSAEPKGLIVL